MIDVLERRDMILIGEMNGERVFITKYKDTEEQINRWMKEQGENQCG